MSDWKSAKTLFFTFTTAGMINASGGGAFFDALVAPPVLLTSNCEFCVLPSADDVPGAAVVVIDTKPVLAPGGRPAVFATACSVCPSGGTMPLAGVTVSHGTSGVAVKLCPANSAPMLRV